jgi:glutamyl-tRNA reductase
MILLAIGCSYRTTPVEVREKLAFNNEQLDRALNRLANQLGYEAVILSTCNRVELYVAEIIDGVSAEGVTTPINTVERPEIVDFLAEFHGLSSTDIGRHLYTLRGDEAVRHLFRVTASLDSMLVGEGQIAGQTKTAYERALTLGCTGPLLNALFPHARKVAKRVRTETGIAHGHVSVSSAAVDYVREVFTHFGDKTVLVIGAGKMGELTLKHLKALRPQRILVTNRSPEKAQSVATGCGGEAHPWEQLDALLARADIVLSTTGAPEPIVGRERFRKAMARRTGGPIVIFDMAIPRDFDPAIHDGSDVFLYNVDHLKESREATLEKRRQHVAPAEAIVEQEAQRFLKDWACRRNGPVIARLNRDFETMRRVELADLFKRLNGKLNDADRRTIEKAFLRLQNRFLDGPIAALTEETKSGTASGHTLLDALRKMFRLQD